METLTREEAAVEIAGYDCPEEPPKLRGVNADTPETRIMPLHFPPDTANGIPSAYELAVIPPREFDRLRSADLRLPGDWRIGPAIHPPAHHPSRLPETGA